MEDRSALFNQLKGFSQRKLKKVETKVVTGLGENLVEKRGAKGLQVLSGAGGGGAGDGDAGQEPPRKLDLQVGMVLPGLLMASDDVAMDKSSLESYGVTHILNLAREVENKFEDDYNYKNVAIQDRPDYELDKVLDDCFDFIDDGRHYGNVLVHCQGTIGLSRTTALCIAYLMAKENQGFMEAWNNVKEARSFVKPNEGFQKQLKEYEVKLRGAAKVKESGIDDPFALRKKQEIEQEKAMVAGAASVKNRMKMFGANLDAGGAAPRSKSVSPSPYANSSNNNNAANSTTTSQRPASKWSTSADNKQQAAASQPSKSMTPEPRSWRQQQQQPSGPPPPPPPMPASSLYDKSIKPTIASSKQSATTTTTTTTRTSSQLPPPPPPPMPTGDLMKDKPAASIKSRYQPNTTTTSSTPPTSSGGQPRKSSVSSSGDEDSSKRVFGRRPPPPMKIRGGISMERQDSTETAGGENASPHRRSGAIHQKSSLKLPLKKQFTSDSEGGGGEQTGDSNPRAPSPSAALRAAKQQASAAASGAAKGDDYKPSGGQLNRSSTKKLLNLIKTKTRTDLTLADGDENDEIDALLGALESESIDNIDWDELGLDEDEVKDIIKQGGDDDDDDKSDADSSSSSSEEDDDDDDDEEEDDEEEVETSTMHYVIRSK